ncbi:MAG: hypothetical protein ACXV3C_04855 [Actinomycetes bacterium]
MRSAYKGIAHAIAAGVVLQATFIALAWFTVLAKVDDGTVFDKNSDPNVGHMLHSVFGMGVLPLLGLALLVVSFFVKLPGGVKLAGFVLLAIVVQVVLAFIAFGVPAIGALHGLNAFVVLGLAEFTARRVPAEPAVTTRPEAAAV